MRYFLILFGNGPSLEIAGVCIYISVYRDDRPTSYCIIAGWFSWSVSDINDNDNESDR